MTSRKIDPRSARDQNLPSASSSTLERLHTARVGVGVATPRADVLLSPSPPPRPCFARWIQHVASKGRYTAGWPPVPGQTATTLARRRSFSRARFRESARSYGGGVDRPRRGSARRAVGTGKRQQFCSTPPTSVAILFRGSTCVDEKKRHFFLFLVYHNSCTTMFGENWRKGARKKRWLIGWLFERLVVRRYGTILGWVFNIFLLFHFPISFWRDRWNSFRSKGEGRISGVIS